MFLFVDKRFLKITLFNPKQELKLVICENPETFFYIIHDNTSNFAITMPKVSVNTHREDSSMKFRALVLEIRLRISQKPRKKALPVARFTLKYIQ